MKTLPVEWYHNKSSWMTAKIFTEWLEAFDLSMRKQKRHVLLFADNAPVHPQDVTLENMKLPFFPPNITAKIQAFKAYYRQNLVKHIIANAATAATADDITVSALYAVYWIESAWNAISETTIKNTFRSAGFENPAVINTVNVLSTSSSITDDYVTDSQALDQLDRVLKHLTIGTKSISAYDYAMLDDETPSFNEWENSGDKALVVMGNTTDDIESNEDFPNENPSSLAESLEFLRRLRLLSMTQQPDLHSFVLQLQSKLTDILLDSNLSKQKSILDYFQRAPENPV